jgi:hypothetical protein
MELPEMIADAMAEGWLDYIFPRREPNRDDIVYDVFDIRRVGGTCHGDIKTFPDMPGRNRRRDV